MRTFTEADQAYREAIEAPGRANGTAESRGTILDVDGFEECHQ